MSDESILMLRTKSKVKKVNSTLWMAWSHSCKWKLVVNFTLRQLCPRGGRLTAVTNWIDGWVYIRPSLEILEKRKIASALSRTEQNVTIIHSFSGQWRGQCLNLFFCPLVEQVGPAGVKKKMNATLNLVLFRSYIWLRIGLPCCFHQGQQLHGLDR
jgi:hypothetical protein